MTLTDLVFSSINAPLTVLLILLAVCRVVTMLFGMDFDFDLDIDLDVDMDVDVDADIDMDTDTSFDATGIEIEDISNVELKNEAIVGKKKKALRWWQVFLIYFNFSEVPFMFTFTSWIFFWWAITVIGTFYTHSYDNTLGLMIFFAAIVPALFINKIFTTPFKAFFKKLNRKGESALDLLGRTGTSLSNISGDKLGSVKLFVENDPINIYAKSLNGDPIAFGKEVLIIKESKDKKFYYIKNY
ncbi:OB-fold-containig protein [uncultured Tenacibaculum sp.]|uniref:OB-fold-containig protein n=1 Tax=uncultured Tenacibaculum sp. TaxID=174713 RepID=UPI0026052DFC|nr:OB-fold-containig protein [uncultured Tenacibaculum sp.]